MSAEQFGELYRIDPRYRYMRTDTLDDQRPDEKEQATLEITQLSREAQHRLTVCSQEDLPFSSLSLQRGFTALGLRRLLCDRQIHCAACSFDRCLGTLGHAQPIERDRTL